ncbi:MAG: hypothetical protein CMH55_11190 [Myxococcales bacterium]|nr:hypothetical protein [Myxococcales bacterium]
MLLGACVPAFWLTRSSPDLPVDGPEQQVDAGPVELPSSIALPPSFRWQHAGTLEQLRPYAGLMPSGTELSDFTFVSAPCRIQVPLGRAPVPSGQCPDLEGPHDVGDRAQLVPLTFRLFGRDLVDGVWPVEGLGPEGWKPGETDLQGLGDLLAIPQAQRALEVESLRAVAGTEGDWLGIELTVKEAPVADFGRWQLTMRYGKDPNYGRQVLSWGDGQRLLWALRLNGGGFGIEMTAQRIRLVLVTGADWEPRLSELLARLPSADGPFPVPGHEGLSVRLAANGLRLEREESPLPTRAVLGQLRSVLQRWSSP